MFLLVGGSFIDPLYFFLNFDIFICKIKNIMKQIRFWAAPFTQQELTTFVSDEDWKHFQDHIDHGEPADFVFQQLWKTHDFKFGQTTILPSYEAFDVEITDCDCEETKKRPLTPKE